MTRRPGETVAGDVRSARCQASGARYCVCTYQSHRFFSSQHLELSGGAAKRNASKRRATGNVRPRRTTDVKANSAILYGRICHQFRCLSLTISGVSLRRPETDALYVVR
jgi:hypothetical protein